MISVIEQSKWTKWCDRHALPTAKALFVLETCYYGLGWRTRPGTLLLTDAELIHHSYSWRDTYYAIFEPSVRVVVRLSDISRVVLRRLGLGRRLFLSMPDACFQVMTRSKQTHDLVLQRCGTDFQDALERRGLEVEYESRMAQQGRCSEPPPR